jgi:hypothetical protein
MLNKFINVNCLLSDTFCKVFKKFTHENNYSEIVAKRIETFLSQRKSSRILEVGGIDRPILKKAPGRVFDGLDIEYSPRMDEIYDNVFIKSIETPLAETYDLIYSMTLLEHVEDNSRSIASIYGGLNSGGHTVHYIPSKSHPYSIVLQMVGPLLGKKLVHTLYPESKGLSGYKTYFNKCSPDEMQGVFEECGFNDIEIIPFYRVSYFRFFFPLFLMVICWENFCKCLKLRQMCSGFIIIATK